MNSLPVIWSGRAWKDLEKIFDLIAKNSKIEAGKQVFRIIDRGEQLAVHPLSGGIQPTIKTELKARYLVQDNYKIIYLVEEHRVVVDTVFDTRQDPQKLKL